MYVLNVLLLLNIRLILLSDELMFVKDSDEFFFDVIEFVVLIFNKKV